MSCQQISSDDGEFLSLNLRLWFFNCSLLEGRSCHFLFLRLKLIESELLFTKSTFSVVVHFLVQAVVLV